MSNVEQAYQKVYNTEGSQDELTAVAMQSLYSDPTFHITILEELDDYTEGKAGPILIHGRYPLNFYGLMDK
mgnify:CR=1 FL=1